MGIPAGRVGRHARRGRQLKRYDIHIACIEPVQGSEMGCQSHFRASVSGNPKRILESLCPDAQASRGQCSEEEIAVEFGRMEKAARMIPSYQILGQKKISDDEIELIMNVYPDRPDIENLRLTFERVGSKWKFHGNFHHF